MVLITKELVVPILQLTYKRVSKSGFEKSFLVNSIQSMLAGDFVLDVGSGLGVDSFIAAAATGEEVHWLGRSDLHPMVLQEGMVVGLDISPGEVRHATARAENRGIANVKVAISIKERFLKNK